MNFAIFLGTPILQNAFSDYFSTDFTLGIKLLINNLDMSFMCFTISRKEKFYKIFFLIMQFITIWNIIYSVAHMAIPFSLQSLIIVKYVTKLNSRARNSSSKIFSRMALFVTLRENCPNTEFSVLRIFLYSD